MRSYVDDFFGGPVRSKKGLEADEINAKMAFDCLIAVGELTGAIMKPEKCFPPARKMEIIGFLYDAVLRYCRLSEKKCVKYISRIDDVLSVTYVQQKKLEKLVGNLTYAAWVSPFGRPFLSVLSCKIVPSTNNPVLVTAAMKNALII